MGDPRSDAISQRVAKAQERAAKEKKQRLEQAMEELKKVRQGKTAEQAREARTSMTDPEARVMKNGSGGYEPASNVQISTDAAHSVIVDDAAVQDSQAALDSTVRRLTTSHGLSSCQNVAHG